MTDIVFKNESFKIIGICMKIHTVLGPGLLEKVYQEAMEHEFKLNNIPYQREKLFNVHYLDIILPSKFVVDFVTYDRLLIEVKAKKVLQEHDFAQAMNYIAICKSPLCLLVNFGGKSLEYKRVVKSMNI